MKYEIVGRIVEIGSITFGSAILPSSTGIVVDTFGKGAGKFFLPTTEEAAKSLAERGFLYQMTKITVDFEIAKK